MLFAHGFGCDQNMWRFVAPRFEDRFRVVLFDHVGAGESELSAYDAERYSSLDGYAADVLEICEELDLQDVVFVGHSVSAMIGVLAAIAEPGRFAKLVLVGPSPRYIDDPPYVGGFTRPDIDELLGSLESNYLGWSSAMAPVIMGNPDRPALGEELRESFCRTDPEIAASFARVTFLSDNRSDLARVDTPALVLQCSQDAIAPVAVGQYVHDVPAAQHLRAARRRRALPQPQRARANGRRDRRIRLAGRTRSGRSMSGAQPRAPLDDADYEHAPCGHLSTAPDGLILRVNETLLSLTGHAREELEGQRRFSDLLTAGGRIYHETHLAPMLQMQGAAGEIALELVRADGTRIPVLVNLALERDARRRARADPHRRLRRHRPAALRAGAAARQAAGRGVRAARHAHSRARSSRRSCRRHCPSSTGWTSRPRTVPPGDGREVGGDFYDVFEIGEGDWAFAIGDVCGKGVDAAVVTALARHTLRAAAVQSTRPSAALDALNRALIAHSTDRFCTASLTRLRRAGGGWKLTTSSGGHPLPLLVRRGQPPVDLGEPGALLGVLDRPPLTDTEAVLEPGDAVVLYTDGVTEGQRDGSTYGETRLKTALKRHADTAVALCEGILADALDFQHGSPRDDIAILVIAAP